MFSTAMQAIQPAIQELLEIFETELADVRFPDIDAALLARAMDQTSAAAEALLQAEASVAAARQALADSQDALLIKCHRAVSYLRIYAEEMPALQARLDAVVLPKPRRLAAQEGEASRTSPRRVRKRAESAELFNEPAQVSA